MCLYLKRNIVQSQHLCVLLLPWLVWFTDTGVDQRQYFTGCESAYLVSIDEQYFRRLLYSHHSWVFIPQSTELLNFQAFSGTMKLISNPFHTQLCKRYTKVFFFFLEFCEAKTKIWFLNLVSVTFRFWDVWFLELFPKPPNWIFLI